MNDENATDSIRPPVTHFPGCWREPGHHECAVAALERLRELLKHAELCPWCDDYQWEGEHSSTCPVFHPDGTFKEQGE